MGGTPNRCVGCVWMQGKNGVSAGTTDLLKENVARELLENILMRQLDSTIPLGQKMGGLPDEQSTFDRTFSPAKPTVNGGSRLSYPEV